MYIISQNKEQIFNIDNVFCIDLLGCEIDVRDASRNAWTIGTYPADRAKEVFQLLVAAIAPLGETQESEPGVWVQASQPQAIYLPEE